MSTETAPIETLGEAPILVADELAMSYRGRAALRGLTFSLRPGRVMGFLGPNGAGKTTSIRILTTILRPTSGRFSIAGIPSDRSHEIRPKIGVLPENLGFPKQLSGIEYLTYFGRLYGRGRVEARERALALMDQVGLRKRATSLIRTYSHGMRQRLGIARALVNDPTVMFLDEPTLGLDPRGQQELLTMLRAIAAERRAGIVLSSHALAEIEDACDDVVVLSDGRIVAKGTVTEVLQQARAGDHERSGVRIHVPPTSEREAMDLLAALPTVAGVERGIGDGHLLVEFVSGDDGGSSNGSANQILGALVGADLDVLRFEVAGDRLQDAFLRLTEGATS